MTPTQEYGWRMLKVGEVIERDDEWFCCNWNHPSALVGRAIDGTGFPYRRRIDPGEGWEIVPKDEKLIGNCWSTDDGTIWFNQGEFEGVVTASAACKAFSRLAYRRRIQPASEWLDIKTVLPKSGDRIWINHVELGVLLNTFRGEKAKMWTHWRPVKPGEIPKAPEPSKKSQVELDREASENWYRSRSDSEDELCERAIRQSYEAGLRDGRKS